MSRTAFAFVVALLALLAPGMAGAQPSQNPPAPGGDTRPAENLTGFEDAAAQIRAAERYHNSCRDMRELGEGRALPANSTLRDFSGSPPFINAIAQFCAYGDFFLRGQPQGAACEPDKRMKLDRRQIEFIAALGKIRGQAVGRIQIECAEYDGPLRLEPVQALGLRLISSRFQRLFIFGGSFRLGIEIAGKSELANGVGIFGTTTNANVAVVDSTLGQDPASRLSFGAAQSSFGGVRFTNSTFAGLVDLSGLTVGNEFVISGGEIAGNLSARGIKVGKTFVLRNITITGDFFANEATVEEALEFSNATVNGKAEVRFLSANGLSIHAKSAFKDEVRIDYARLGSQIWIDDVDFDKLLVLNHSNVDGLILLRNVRQKGETNANYVRFRSYLSIEDSKFAGRLFIDHVRGEGDLSISKSEFTGGAYMRYAEIARRLVISERSKFAEGLYLNRLRSAMLELRNSETPKDAILTGSTVGELLAYGFKTGGQLFAGNSRLHVLSISHATEKGTRLESEIGELDCSDCVVDQYILLGGQFSRGVRLSGARVQGSLNFSESSTRASWKADAVLDLTGVQAQVIQANDQDLRVMGADASCPGQLVEARLAGVKFESLVGGRVNEMRIAGPQPAGLFDRPVPALKEWILSRPSCWAGRNSRPAEGGKAAVSHARFDPQPFEVFAQALDRSGRPEAATQLRILKRDEEIKVSDYSLLRRIALAVGKVVVGYGYENEKALRWFVMLIAVGTIVYLFGRQTPPRMTGEQPAKWYAPDVLVPNIGYGLFYSIDRSVPQLTLDKVMDRYSALHPIARYYFYVHRVLGASILIYAVAGLTGVLK